MKKSACLSFYLLVIFFNSLTVSGQTATNDLPADKKATKETIALYHNLKKLLNEGIMFGHQDDLAYGVGWKYEPGRSDIKDVTGDYPAVYGFELGRLEMDQPVNLDSVPFDTSPLLTYNEARTMVITHAIEAVQINSPPMGQCVDQRSLCEPAEVSRRKIVRAP